MAHSLKYPSVHCNSLAESEKNRKVTIAEKENARSILIFGDTQRFV